jgi:hypothetical protein
VTIIFFYKPDSKHAGIRWIKLMILSNGSEQKTSVRAEKGTGKRKCNFFKKSVAFLENIIYNIICVREAEQTTRH